MSQIAKHNPAPWERETVQNRSEQTAYEVVKDANGKILFDTLNSDVAEIHTEHDEDGAIRWDETGRINLALAAVAPDLLSLLEQYVVFEASTETVFHSHECKSGRYDPNSCRSNGYPLNPLERGELIPAPCACRLWHSREVIAKAKCGR
ncbi:hypothetical protein VT84_09580 [Gemmata sp. SH-PL17]|uniref:hypothetical protein n=1 Tax=Gemmata sp. SH-PL17 TaxID=1630693 RepID=UPI00078E07F0|nr:hypothetical protein [Gemmata sp. SH-PL17]AMV24635.1 hypothetical protein VT84_09580 [Gemmata sp. SH-PL17]